MLEHFDSPDVYMLAGFYFAHANDWYTGAFCMAFAIFDAYVLQKDKREETACEK